MKRVSLLLLVTLGVVLSCSDHTTIYSNEEEQLSLESSGQVLYQSVVYDKAGVLDILDENQGTGKSSKLAADSSAGDYPITLVAQIDPPSFPGGTRLTASHIFQEGDFIYVSYNTVDEQFAGAIDVIDISDPNIPVVSSRLYYPNADINSITYEDGYVYAVGGLDASKFLGALTNSFIVKIPTINGIIDLDLVLGVGRIYGYQQGYVSTDLAIAGNVIYVTSGSEGSLAQYDKDDLDIKKEVPFSDLRSVAFYNEEIAVLNAGTGITILDDKLKVQREIAISTNFGQSTKKSVDFSIDKIYVAEGSKGAGVYNSQTGELVEYIPILIYPEYLGDGEKVTNAVALNEGVILMANGGAGLCLSEKKIDNTDIVGIIQLDGSANYVTSLGDYVFVASGKEGVQILKLNRPSDTLLNQCSAYPEYTGDEDLRIDDDEDLAYSGAKSLKSVEVKGALVLCGSWTVKEDTEVRDAARFEMNGTYVVGTNDHRKDITVKEDATFTVNGNLTIYGDLILEKGSTLHFLDGSVVNIFGSVDREDETVQVLGNFEDVRNAF